MTADIAVRTLIRKTKSACFELTTGRFRPPPEGRFASFAFTPDGKALIAITPGHTPSLWDSATGKQIRTFAVPNGVQ